MTAIRRDEAPTLFTTSHDSDSDPDDLGYFEPVDSDDSDDSEVESTKVQSSRVEAAEVKMTIQVDPLCKGPLIDPANLVPFPPACKHYTHDFTLKWRVSCLRMGRYFKSRV